MLAAMAQYSRAYVKISVRDALQTFSNNGCMLLSFANGNPASTNSWTRVMRVTWAPMSTCGVMCWLLKMILSNRCLGLASLALVFEFFSCFVEAWKKTKSNGFRLIMDDSNHLIQTWWAMSQSRIFQMTTSLQAVQQMDYLSWLRDSYNLSAFENLSSVFERSCKDIVAASLGQTSGLEVRMPKGGSFCLFERARALRASLGC